MFELAKILVPIDFSKYSEAAQAQAVEIARRSGAELHLFHVASDRSPAAPSQAVERLEQSIPAGLMLTLKVAYAAVHGSPVEEIVRKALSEQFDLIVMGTHGRTGLVRLAMGSVAENVLRAAPCPVMIVPHPDQAADRAAAEAPPAEHAPALELILRAAAQRATDVHIDPAEDGKHIVRFRIDGHLQRYCRIDNAIAERLVHQLKVLANLDIADPFQSREGRLRLPPSMSDMEVRITTAPVYGGQAVALRLFTREAASYRLEQLGFTQDALEAVKRMAQRGEGVVLCAGPSGSGKTTTVYSMIDRLCTGAQNIVSIEDPVEFPVPFARQVEVDARHGITMTSGLRTLLRMDPDVIFLGEIRDREAADMVMRAASSGKYVFSTLHARDAAGALTALRDLHSDSRSVAANLTGIISQRLVRRLCPHCRQTCTATKERRQLLGEEGAALPEVTYSAQGCDQCRGTGYHGRVGVFETVIADDAVRDAVLRGAPEDEVRQIMRHGGAVSLTADALVKVRDAITSLEEVLEMRWL